MKVSKLIENIQLTEAKSIKVSVGKTESSALKSDLEKAINIANMEIEKKLDGTISSCSMYFDAKTYYQTIFLVIEVSLDWSKKKEVLDPWDEADLDNASDIIKNELKKQDLKALLVDNTNDYLKYLVSYSVE